MKSLSLFALLLVAGVADAQCQWAGCSLLNGLTVRETTRNAQRTTQAAAPRVAVVQTSSTAQTVRVRQRVRLFRR